MPLPTRQASIIRSARSVQRWADAGAQVETNPQRLALLRSLGTYAGETAAAAFRARAAKELSRLERRIAKMNAIATTYLKKRGLRP